MSFPSPTSRPRRRPALAGTALAAALVFGAAACGSDGGGSAGGSFCSSMKDLGAQLTSAGKISDPQAMSAAFDQMSKITPPPELANDWHTIVSAKDAIDNPTAATSGELQQFTTASDHVSAYLRNTCHIKP